MKYNHHKRMQVPLSTVLISYDKKKKKHGSALLLEAVRSREGESTGRGRLLPGVAEGQGSQTSGPSSAGPAHGSAADEALGWGRGPGWGRRTWS